MTEYVLGIDGGQTATRLVIATREGQVVWQDQAAPALPAQPEDFVADTEHHLRWVLAQSLAQGGWAGTTFEMAALGMTGGEPDSPLRDAYRRAADSALRAKGCTVVHDVVTNLLGASAGQPGIVVIGGGGSVAYGLAADGREWTSGGWGFRVGDEGSGYNIGRAAINAAFRSLDRRDPPTTLTEKILRHFAVSNAVALKYDIFDDRVGFGDIAGLTPLIAGEAKRGDDTARVILEGAGRHLAEAVIAVARVLELSGQAVDLYPTGGLFQETFCLVPAFVETVRTALPRARIRTPAFQPVVGAIFLAFRTLGWPLDRRVFDNVTASWSGT